MREECRGQGIGTKLIERMLADGRAEGKRAAVLTVADTNTGARRLYERLGFRVTSPVFDGPKEHDIEGALGRAWLLESLRNRDYLRPAVAEDDVQEQIIYGVLRRWLELGNGPVEVSALSDDELDERIKKLEDLKTDEVNTQAVLLCLRGWLAENGYDSSLLEDSFGAGPKAIAAREGWGPQSAAKLLSNS